MVAKMTTARARDLYRAITLGRGMCTDMDRRVYSGLKALEAVEPREITIGQDTKTTRARRGIRIMVTQRGYELAVAHYGDTNVGREIRAAWATLYPAEEATCK